MSNHERCACDNCNWAGTIADILCDLEHTPNLGERLDVGGEVPVGECPECGALAYLVSATYSVLLARPDYIANDSTDTFFTSVEAANPIDAVAHARAKACAADGTNLDCILDYAVLLVTAGEHDDLNPES